MKEIDVFRQYFGAECVCNDVERKGVLVTLTATSDCGMLRYTVAVSFFPHRDEEDFGITYDAYASKELFYGKGRRSKKKDKLYLELVQDEANALAKTFCGTILWENPLNEAVYG